MLTLLRNGFIQRSRGFVKFQIRTCSRFENFTNPLVVRSPRSGGTRSGCNPRERCGERSGADFATTVRVFLWAGIKITKFSIFTKSEYANKRVLWLSTPLIEIPCYMLCFLSESSLFVVVGVGKFILFLALAKRGQGEALPTFWPARGDGEMWDVLFPMRWPYSSVL